MSKNTKKNDAPQSNDLVDLSSLVGMTFGPSWSDSKFKTEKVDRSQEEQKFSRSRSDEKNASNQRRDRRPAMDKKRSEQFIPEFFEPTIDIAFYPEDEPFLTLVKAIRTSCKTYELFELANLILEKPERFLAVITPKKAKDNTVPKLYVSPIDGMPFEKEEQAVAYTLKHHVNNFFEIEEIEVEAPKGSFPVINRCGFTGELLGPPNYHRYQELIKEHYANNLSHMAYDRFLSKIESVKDEELIKAWTEKMTKGKRYKLKKSDDKEEQVFNSWEDARSYLLAHRKKDLVRESNSVRCHGVLLNAMPKGDIRKAIEMALKAQRDFPLDTANNIRGRLRRMNLAIYKKGSRGVTYVCAVKRKFRQEGVSFTDNLQKLIEFIETHPNCLASKLPELYLGIKQNTSGASLDAIQNEKIDESILQKSVDQQARIRQLMLDLRWLVSEGYVTEYGNGSLLIPTLNGGNPDKKNEAIQDDLKEEPQEESKEESIAEESAIKADL